jgi:hypothetical protein
MSTALCCYFSSRTRWHQVDFNDVIADLVFPRIDSHNHSAVVYITAEFCPF